MSGMSILGNELRFVNDEEQIIGTVVRAEIVVPPGNKKLGIGCHIILTDLGEEVAVPNMRISLHRHMGRRLLYRSQKDLMFGGVRYHILSTSKHGAGSLAGHLKDVDV